MDYKRMTKAQLISEISNLNDRISNLEKSDLEYKQSEIELIGAKAKEELEEEHKKSIQFLMDSIPGFSFIKDGDLKYVGANHTFCDLLKIPYDQIAGKTDYDIFPPDLAAKYIADDTRVMKSGKPLLLEEITVDQRKKGKRFYVATRKLPWFDDNGKIRGIYGLGFDISELKEAQRSAEESKEKATFQKVLLDTVPDIIYVYDLIDKKNIFSNEGISKVLGYSVKEIRDMGEKLIPNLMHPDDFRKYLEKTIPKYQKAETGEIIEHEYRMKHKNKEWLWLHSKEVMILRNKENKPKQIFGITSDITDRKQSEELLLTERQQAQQYLDIAGVMFVALDENGSITLINQKGCDILGYSEAEILNKNWFDLCIAEEDREEIKGVFKQLLSGEIDLVEYFENAVVTKTGEHKIVAFHNTLIRDKESNITGTLGSGEDITERRHADEKLRQNEELYRSVVGALSEGLIVQDQSDKIIFANQAASNMLGLSMDQLKGKDSYDPRWKALHQDGTPFQPEDHPSMISMRTGAPVDNTIMNIHTGDGKRRVLSINSRPIFNDSNKVVQVVITFTDMTEGVQAEQELKLSEQKYKSLIEFSPDMIMLADLKGFILESNNAVHHYLGYPLNDIVGKHFTKLHFLRARDLPKYIAILKSLARGETPAPFDAEVKHKDGSVLFLEIYISILNLPDRAPQLQIIAHDITERKQAEDALIHSNSLMQYVIEHNNGAIAIHDRGLKYIYVSKRYLHDYNVTDKNIIGKHHYDVFPDLPQKWRDVHQLALAGKVSAADNDRYERGDGNVEWTRWECRPWYEADGSIGGIIVYTEVITERKRAEVELMVANEGIKKSEKYLDNIINNIGDPVFVKDSERRFHLVNDAFCKLLDLEREKILGKTLAEDFPPDEMEHFFRIDNLVLSEGIENVSEEMLTFRGGQTKTVSTKKSRFIDSQGAKFLIGIIHDITERKLAEKTLREDEKRLESIFRATPTGIGVVSNRVFQLVNDKVIEMTGYSNEELVGQSSRILYASDEEFNRVGKVKYEEIEKFGTGTIETQFKHKDGHLIDVLLSSTPIDFDDHSKGVTFTALNITDRKQAEEERLSMEAQLRQSQKLEAVGTMAGGIAHDFNNILQGLYLYSGIIKDQLKDGDEELKSNFQHIIESSKRAKELVKQILTFSRKEDTDLKSLKIQYLLKDVLKLIRASTPTTIEVSENIDTGCGPVLCDSTQLHQVFVNLCNNAVHAMKEKGGTLSVSLKEVEAQIELEPGIVSKNEAGVIELIVADTGHGMDAKMLELIFDPFYTTKGVSEGTGLGLSIVHGIIKDMQGQITVESKPGEGTTFRILMPISKAEAIEEELEEPDAEVESLRVLFVDDDKLISGAGKLILEQKGHKVTVAENGHKALELFQKDMQAYDLIITDLTMPKMTGLELGKAIRKLSKDVSILLTSGNLDPHLQSEYESLGFNGFVRKPWTAPEMLKAINSLDLA